MAASAHLPGVGGSLWRTDLSIHNPLPAPQELELWLYPRGSDNSGVACVAGGSVAGGASVAFEDVVMSLFGVEGAGGIGVGTRSGEWAALQVGSRTYNLTASGTYGQSIPGLPASAAVAAGETVTLLALHENAAYRTNLGFLEVSGLGAEVGVRLYAADGTLLREDLHPLRPHEALQVNQAYGLGADVTGGFAQVTVTSGGSVLTYASVVDNLTGDPTYVAP